MSTKRDHLGSLLDMIKLIREEILCNQSIAGEYSKRVENRTSVGNYFAESNDEMSTCVRDVEIETYFCGTSVVSRL